MPTVKGEAFYHHNSGAADFQYAMRILSIEDVIGQRVQFHVGAQTDRLFQVDI